MYKLSLKNKDYFTWVGFILIQRSDLGPIDKILKLKIF